jgi:RNA polymerase sigma factor (sigma-70 family)
MQDADAFAALYDREAQAVLVFIARRTLDAELALDLTAETFAQAFRGRRSFGGSTEMEERAWLYTIARRQIARYHRRGGVERRALRALAAEVPTVHEDDIREIEEAAGLEELRTLLGSELERLSRDQRDALRLRVVGLDVGVQQHRRQTVGKVVAFVAREGVVEALDLRA